MLKNKEGNKGKGVIISKKGGWQFQRERRAKDNNTSSRESNSEWSLYSLECALGSPCKEFPIVGNPKPTIQIGCEPKNRLSPLTIFLVRIIGTICGNLLHICGSAEMRTGEMSKSQAASYAENGSRRSFRGST